MSAGNPPSGEVCVDADAVLRPSKIGETVLQALKQGVIGENDGVCRPTCAGMAAIVVECRRGAVYCSDVPGFKSRGFVMQKPRKPISVWLVVLAEQQEDLQKGVFLVCHFK